MPFSFTSISKTFRTPKAASLPQGNAPNAPPLSASGEKKGKGKERPVDTLGSHNLRINGARSFGVSAVWWASEEGEITHRRDTDEQSLRRTKYFEGELLLPKDLVPSFTFGGFRVQVRSLGLLVC